MRPKLTAQQTAGGCRAALNLLLGSPLKLAANAEQRRSRRRDRRLRQQQQRLQAAAAAAADAAAAPGCRRDGSSDGIVCLVDGGGSACGLKLLPA
jgi:hypothetical protein